MPLYKTLAVSPDITIYLWKVEEQESVLRSPIALTENSRTRLEGMKSELHRRGFLSIRHLLAEAGYKDFDLYYDELGKPHLQDGNYISITHSHNFTGIIVSKHIKVGIDIEKQRDKIARIAHKFTDLEYDPSSHNLELVRKLTVLWGAKESVYKILSTPGISFYQHIYIREFELSVGNTIGKADFQGELSHYNISFLEFEGFTCVYALLT
jgi:phosphopantetheinyl transferase